MRADEQFENLYHVASCHSESCFAVDLEFDSPSGVRACVPACLRACVQDDGVHVTGGCKYLMPQV